MCVCTHVFTPRRVQSDVDHPAGGRKDVVDFAKRYMTSPPLMLEMEGRRRLPPQLKHYALEAPRVKFIELVRKVFFLDGLTGLLVFVNGECACMWLRMHVWTT